MKTVWPCSACMLYRSSRGGWFNPTRSILPEAPKEAGVWAFITGLLGRRRSRSTRINEEVHWSVRERQQWAATLVEKIGVAKYAPPNLRRDVKEYSKALPLELKLLDRTARSWTDHCPLEKAKLPCQCATRDPQRVEPVLFRLPRSQRLAAWIRAPESCHHAQNSGCKRRSPHRTVRRSDQSTTD